MLPTAQPSCAQKMLPAAEKWAGAREPPKLAGLLVFNHCGILSTHSHMKKSFPPAVERVN